MPLWMKTATVTLVVLATGVAVWALYMGSLIDM